MTDAWEHLTNFDEPLKAQLKKLMDDNRALMEAAPGSSHNHQAWPGGYLDHICETLKIALDFYENCEHPLPFEPQDAHLVLMLHDLEKPWKYAGEPGLDTKEARQAFKFAKIAEYGIQLTDEHINALRYVEGEGNDYSGKKRVMGPLAAFAHICDVASARIWFDYPKREGEQ